MAMDRDAHADDATAPAGWTCVAEHGFTGLSLGAYLRALEVWLTVPEHVNRSILRADMLHDSTKSSGSTTASVVTAIDIHPATTTVLEVLLEPQSPEDAQQDVRMTRHILRRLVPRVHRDTNTMMQALWCANVSRTVRDDNGRTHTVHKWHVTQHRADPEAGEHVDEGDLQFGFFHPPARDFALCFEHKVGAGSGHEDAVAEDAETTLYNGRLCVVARPFASALSDKESMDRLCSQFSDFVQKLLKFSRGNQRAPGGCYAKRIFHDMIVPKETCQDRYLELKSKYAAKWIAQWGKGEGHAKMTTDPDVGNGRGSARYMCLAHNKFCARSFVHRNMSTRRLEVWQVDENMPTLSHAFPPPQVAAFLICLWELRHGKDAAQHVRFVDLGAGNGFLVYLLAEEGYSGYGVDVSSRGIWSMYGERTHLERATLDAPSAIFDVCTGRLVVPDGNGMSTSAPPTTELWLVGNHSDELTPWLPIIAAKSNLYAYERYGLTRNHCHFFVLPCCFHDLRGDRNAFGRTIPFSENIADSESLSGKYGHYIRWIEWIAENICGFRMQREWLRIPSTKNVCLVASDGPQQRGEGWREIMDAITDLTSSVVFAPRLSDKEKGELRDMHKRRQTSINGDGTFLEDDETVAARQELLGELGGFDFSDQEQ